MSTNNYRRNSYLIFQTLGCCVLIVIFSFVGFYLVVNLVEQEWYGLDRRAIRAALYFFVPLGVPWVLLLLFVFVVMRRPVWSAVVAWLFPVSLLFLTGEYEASNSMRDGMVKIAVPLGVMLTATVASCFIMRRLFGPGALK